MKVELSALEIEALAAAVAEKLAVRLDMLLTAQVQRALPLPEQKALSLPEPTATPLDQAILNQKEVTALTKLGRTTLWRMVKEGLFPRQVRLSCGRVGWKRIEVMGWVETRKAA